MYAHASLPRIHSWPHQVSHFPACSTKHLGEILQTPEHHCTPPSKGPAVMVSDLVMPQYGNPPLAQERACSIEKGDPQSHLTGKRLNGQSYLRARASRKHLCEGKNQIPHTDLAHNKHLKTIPTNVTSRCSPAFLLKVRAT